MPASTDRRAVSALMTAVETVGDAALGRWLPFYYEAKLAFLAWLVLPAYRGALVVHEKWLSPLFLQHEETIDATLSDVKRRASEKIVQVCKETAAGALRRSSGAVAQSQQYVASQIVQQAISASLGSPVASTSTRSPEKTAAAGALPGLLSFLSSAAASKTDAVDKPADTTEDGELKSKSPAKKRQGKSPAKADKKAAATAKEVDNSSSPASRSAKTRQLVEHFKKMLLKGFQLQYFASKGVVKQRLLRLDDTDSRYITFISARDAEAEASSPSKKKKSARLLLVNILRVSGTIEADGSVPTDMLVDMELAKAFSIDNGKGGPMVFQAESQKNRDLLVAGLRLLIAEHKQRRGEDKASDSVDAAGSSRSQEDLDDE